MVIDAINRVLCQKDDFLQTLRANIATVVLQGDALSPEVIDERLNKLQKELLKKVNQKDDYDAIADEILRLRDQRRQAEVDSVIKDEQMNVSCIIKIPIIAEGSPQSCRGNFPIIADLCLVFP